ncbi:MAG: hypothetical protein Kow0099_15520 [Candidatus Abyssubacteria bacterium]
MSILPLRAVIQPLRDNYRRAEIVLIVPNRLPDVQGDPNLYALVLLTPLVVTPHRALHRDGTVKSRAHAGSVN